MIVTVRSVPEGGTLGTAAPLHQSPRRTVRIQARPAASLGITPWKTADHYRLTIGFCARLHRAPPPTGVERAPPRPPTLIAQTAKGVNIGSPLRRVGFRPMPLKKSAVGRSGRSPGTRDRWN